MSTILQTPDVAQLLSRNKVHRNLHPAPLVEAALRRGESELAARGSLVADTGKRTGRSPKDKFTVKDSITADRVAWGSANQPFPPEKFDALYDRVLDYLKDKELFVQDLFSGADPKYQLPIQVINEYAWHNLFVRQLFIRPTVEELKTHKPEFTIVSAPGFKADPRRDGAHSEAFVLVNFTKKLVLIGGTEYAGEMKKSIFGVMNFVLPQRNVFPMHCSANIGVRRRDRAVLRALRHRQDDAVGRSHSPPDRRRRARLERHRHLQLRRRLLRQVHSPVAGERAADMECAALRFGAGERGARSAHPRSRLRRR